MARSPVYCYYLLYGNFNILLVKFRQIIIDKSRISCSNIAISQYIDGQELSHSFCLTQSYKDQKPIVITPKLCILIDWYIWPILIPIHQEIGPSEVRATSGAT